MKHITGFYLAHIIGNFLQVNQWVSIAYVNQRKLSTEYPDLKHFIKNISFEIIQLNKTVNDKL